MKLNNLSHQIEGRTLFTELSVELEPGKLHGIIGPNGCGKSTLLRLLAGIDKPQSGTVLLQNRELQSFSARERAQQLAYLPQQNNIYHDLTAREVVLLGRAPYQNIFSLWNDQDRRIAEDCLNQVGLAEESGRFINSLSGGEFQRVMLARMLATEANILLLDEAITALDINHSLVFLDMCRDLCAQGKTVIIVMHQLELAHRYCDDTLLLGIDQQGSYIHGPTGQVMNSKNLGRAFNVSVKKSGQTMIFNRKH